MKNQELKNLINISLTHKFKDEEIIILNVYKKSIKFYHNSENKILIYNISITEFLNYFNIKNFEKNAIETSFLELIKSIY